MYGINICLKSGWHLNSNEISSLSVLVGNSYVDFSLSDSLFGDHIQTDTDVAEDVRKLIGKRVEIHCRNGDVSIGIVESIEIWENKFVRIV